MRICNVSVVSAAGIILLLNGVLMTLATPHLPSELPDRESKTMRAGWGYECQATATSCKKCVPAGGDCGDGVMIENPIPNLPDLPHCWLQKSFGHPGCATAAAVRHCVFDCFRLGTNCPEKSGGTNCGEFQQLAGNKGCEFVKDGDPCVASTCKNSGGTGQTCYECN